MVNNIPVNGWPQLKDLEAVQPILNRLDKIEAWKRTVKEDTFTGDDITIENALALPARSLITEINALQDLHGLPFPYVGGAYKNKLPMTVESIKANNIRGTWSGNTYTVANGTFDILTDADGNVTGIEINGTFTATVSIKLLLPTPKQDSYILTGCPSGGGASTYVLWGGARNSDDTGWITSFTDKGSGYNFSVSAESAYIQVEVEVKSGYTANHVVFKPMIRLSTETDPTFAPYSNECPIYGRTEATISRYSNNLVNADELEDDKYLDGTGTAVYNVDCYVTGFIPLKSGQPIYIPATGTARRCTYYADKSFKEYLNVSAAQVLTPNFDGYLRVSVRYDTIAKNDLQINYGSAAITFEPQGIDITIQLGTTVYGADINWDTGVMTVKTTEETFDGSSSTGWSYVSDYGSVSRFDCTNVVGKAGGNVISNYLKGGNNTSIISNEEHVYLHGSYGYLIICVETSRLATKDVTGLMSYLASNPLQVEYELATPTTIQLTPTQLEMLKGYNHITLYDGYGTIELKALTGANWS